jgi:hypothetical protein
MEELLNKILKELEHHTKLLELLIDTIEQKQSNHKDKSKEIFDQVEKLSEQLKGIPGGEMIDNILRTARGKE